MLGPRVDQGDVETVMREVSPGVAADRPGADDDDALVHSAMLPLCRDGWHDKLLSDDGRRSKPVPPDKDTETMNWTERRERFRAILAGNRCVHTGSVYDAISARIAEDLGFEVGIFSGSIGSMAVLGAPDLVVMTLTEFAAQANRVCRAGNLALLVDADPRYGNALHVRRTVEELETAGICAMSIEDTVLPRPYGPNGKPTL